MKLQNAPYTCGSVAIINAMMALGVAAPPEETVVEMAGTSPIKGTSPHKMRKGLKKLGVKARPFFARDADNAWWLLVGALDQGHPVILLVDKEEHWVVAVGKLGVRALLVDSADGAVVVSLTKDEVLARWLGAGKVVEYYGIIVG